MQNDFEKQVRQKMEELDFLPSPPVWENIEKQIRQDKERRRLVIWLPLALLTLGLGGWLLVSQLSVKQASDLASHSSSVPAQNEAPAVKNDQAQSFAGETGEVEIAAEKPGTEQREKIATVKTETTVIPKITTAKPLPVINQSEPKNTEPVVVYGNENTVAANKQQNAGNDQLTPPEAGEVTRASEVQKAQMDPLRVEKNRAVALENPGGEVLHEQVLDEKKDTEKAVQDAANEITKPKRAQVNRKWQLGLAAGAGISGEGRGISLARMEAALPSNTIGSPVLSAPEEGTPINFNFSYNAGIAVRKKLNERFAFITGLDYQFYSTSRKVGMAMYQDSSFNPNFTVGTYFLNYGPNQRNITNRYHFISIPLLLQWKTGATNNVHIDGGLRVQQLVSSGAYEFNSNYSIYYKDQDVFTKTQLFATLGVGYNFQFRNGNDLHFGPSLQYGINSMHKYESRRLYALALQARYFFGKHRK